jgi:hypothetical protein
MEDESLADILSRLKRASDRLRAEQRASTATRKQARIAGAADARKRAPVSKNKRRR